MISSKHLKEEIDILEKTCKQLISENLPFEAALLKASILQIKLLANVRTNQALLMKDSNVDLISRRIESEDTKEGQS